jgi:hypothetical protein
MPIMHAVRVICTAEALALNSPLIRGRAGRYMSMHRGPKMVKLPMRAINRHPDGTPGRRESVRGSLRVIGTTRL